MVTGDQHQLQEFVNWCKHGPEKATVDDVNIIEEEETSFNEFEVVRGR